MNLNELTIVIGAYGDVNKLKDTLNSFLAYESSGINIIVIDDNQSEDLINSSKSVCQSYKALKIKYIRNDSRIGVPHVFKKWHDVVETEFFMFFGVGDRVMPNTLQVLVKALYDHPEASLAHGGQKQKIIVGKDSINADQIVSKDRLEIISTGKYLKSLLIGGDYKMSQMATVIRTEQFRYKVKMSKNWFWDYDFHLEYHLFNDFIASIPLFVTEREERIISRDYYSDLYQFRLILEQKLQAIKFIETYESKLIEKNIPVVRYRNKIALSLLLNSSRISNLSRRMYIIREALKVITGDFLTFILSTMLIPTNYLFKLIVRFRR